MIETLDVIKFICKDLWTIVFRKQIDNLKTNHRVRYPHPPIHTPTSYFPTTFLGYLVPVLSESGR